MLLFVWQVAFLCGGYLFQNEQINAQTSYFVEEVQEDEEINIAQFTEDFSDSDLLEQIEEVNKIISSNLFNFKTSNIPPDVWTHELSSLTHFQNPYCPPEVII